MYAVRTMCLSVHAMWEGVLFTVRLVVMNVEHELNLFFIDDFCCQRTSLLVFSSSAFPEEGI